MILHIDNATRRGMTMTTIHQANCYRVRIATNRTEIRTPEVLQGAYRTGSKNAAIHMAVKDIEAMGEGAVFMTEHYTDRFGWQQVQCGEWKDGRYYPRNNY
jgi:hypothetical protein